MIKLATSKVVPHIHIHIGLETSNPARVRKKNSNRKKREHVKHRKSIQTLADCFIFNIISKTHNDDMMRIIALMALEIIQKAQQ